MKHFNFNRINFTKSDAEKTSIRKIKLLETNKNDKITIYKYQIGTVCDAVMNYYIAEAVLKNVENGNPELRYFKAKAITNNDKTLPEKDILEILNTNPNYNSLN